MPRNRTTLTALALVMAAAIAGGALFLSGVFTSQAVQNPQFRLDMATAGNTYSDPGAGGDNSMTVGAIDDCLTTATGVNTQHTHSTHLIVTNVEDLVAWQARINYDGSKMKPSAFNFNPFTDSSTGETLSFLNLPIDSDTTTHRALTTASAGLSQDVAGSTALIGASYQRTQTAAVSPDTPAKDTPDDASYSAPSGGVLGTMTLQVKAGQLNQLLTIDLDDDVPNAPGSRAVVFTGSGTTDINLSENALGDGQHREGDLAPACAAVPATPTNTPGPPTPTPAPPLPCEVNFSSPLFVPTEGVFQDLVIDPGCKRVYLTNASLNQVEVFSLDTGRFQSPIPVGPSPAGLDITPDGGTMYVATSGGISVVDLDRHQEVRRILVPTSSDNDWPYSIAIANNGLALFTTTFGGSGFGGRMMQLSLDNDVVGQRRDFSRFSGQTSERTHLEASGDRGRIAIVDGDSSSGPVFAYTASSNSFSPEKDLGTGVGYIATDRTGSIFVVNPDTYVLDSNLNVMGTVRAGAYGVAIEPLGTSAYVVGNSSISVIDLRNLIEIGSLPLGDTVTDPRRYLGLAGRIAISAAGELLAVLTDHGLSIVQASPLPTPTPTPTATPTPTPTPTPTATPTPVGVDDFDLRRIMSPFAILSGESQQSDTIAVKVRNDGDHIETVRVYIDVIPPGGASNPGGCVPTGRVLDGTVTLDPTGVTLPKQQNVFADTGTLGDGLVEFSCANRAAVAGFTYTILAAVDAHADDLGACGPGAIQSLACFNALANDDGDPTDNRLSRSAPRVEPP